MNTIRLACLVFAAVCITTVTACDKPTVSWQFDISSDQGMTTIETRAFSLVFEGIEVGKMESGHSNGGSGSLVVTGSGRHEITVTINNRPFNNVYLGGLNTMNFEGHTFVIANEGTELRYEDEVYPLGDTHLQLTIAPNGAVLSVDRIPLRKVSQSSQQGTHRPMRLLHVSKFRSTPHHEFATGTQTSASRCNMR
ncbi:MAG: hypothetical protein GY894_07160 [Planctomycetes bacterium]|jgi:hypothetical protein|nr:hypothetical protein [Planctomycetota bacterium]MCP4839122.1 hypothetical protein [Planctomycetota bacterium]